MSEQANGTRLVAEGAAGGQWVLDPAGSRFEFHVRHFWGAVTVHGTFDSVSGTAEVGADGAISGRIVLDATTLNTKNKQRDKHLRSADFFDADQHPHMVLMITRGELTGQADLACDGTLEAAGHTRPVRFTAHVDQASAEAVVLTAEFDVDRTGFEMTWSPLRMASAIARGTATARFVRP